MCLQHRGVDLFIYFDFFDCFYCVFGELPRICGRGGRALQHVSRCAFARCSNELQDTSLSPGVVASMHGTTPQHGSRRSSSPHDHGTGILVSFSLHSSYSSCTCHTHTQRRVQTRAQCRRATSPSSTPLARPRRGDARAGANVRASGQLLRQHTHTLPTACGRVS